MPPKHQDTKIHKKSARQEENFFKIEKTYGHCHVKHTIRVFLISITFINFVNN